MALVDSRKQRIMMMCGMYFAQGVPWGYMVTALVSYLTQRGMSAGDAGKLTAVVMIPWSFKLIWAPVIETVTIRSMGRRRAWIIGAECMMASSLLGILAMGEGAANDITLLYWMFFIHNCFASLQDVATDALAVDVLPPNEQGKMNGLMWGSKLVGKAVGAYGMALVIDGWGLTASVWVQFAILSLIMYLPFLILERPGEKRFPWSSGKAQGVETTSNFRNPLDVGRNLLQGYSLVTTAAFLGFGVMHNIGWGIVEVVTKPLYIQELGWDFVEYSRTSGFYGVIAELLLALIGGFVADRFGRRKVITAGYGGYGVLAIVFALSPSLWQHRWFTEGYLILNQGLLAMGAVGFLSMGMKISWTKAAATMFTVYMTLSNVGHVIGNWIVEPLTAPPSLSHETIFLVAGLACIGPLAFIFFVRPATVDAAREREAATMADPAAESAAG